MGQHDHIALQQRRGIILIGRFSGRSQGRNKDGLDCFIFWIGTVGSWNAGLYFVDNTLGSIHLIETWAHCNEVGQLAVTRARCATTSANGRTRTGIAGLLGTLCSSQSKGQLITGYGSNILNGSGKGHSSDGKWRYRRAGTQSSVEDQPLRRSPAEPANYNEELSRRYSGL